MGLSPDQDPTKHGDPEIIRYAKGEDVNAVGHLADGVLSAFLASDLAKLQSRVLGVEEELRGPVVDGAPDLLARVDLLVETDAELQVIDFKTARTRWSAEQVEDAGEQLMLYSCLVGRLIPDKPVRLEYAVITKAKSPVVERYPVAGDRHRIDRTRRILRSVWRAIQAGDFFPTPSPLNCPACPFREACRAWG